jgi:hypothetical protein
MAELRKELSQYPVTTRLSLSGTMVVARDIAHAKILERLESGKGLPQYVKDYMIYYAGPAKTPEGYASGSFGNNIPVLRYLFSPYKIIRDQVPLPPVAWMLTWIHLWLLEAVLYP